MVEPVLSFVIHLCAAPVLSHIRTRSLSFFLRYLSAANCRFSGTLEPLSNLTSMVWLILANNLLTGTLEPLATYHNISSIDVSNNLLSGNLSAIATLTSLAEELMLDGNSFSGDLSPLRNLIKLMWVSAQNNLLVDSAALEAFRGYTALQTLALTFNGNEDGNGLAGTLEPLSGVTTLRSLWLGDNYFVGDLAPLSKLVQLYEMLAYNNGLTGTLAPLSNLTLMQQLVRSISSSTGSPSSASTTTSSLLLLLLLLQSYLLSLNPFVSSMSTTRDVCILLGHVPLGSIMLFFLKTFLFGISCVSNARVFLVLRGWLILIARLNVASVNEM